MVQHMLLFPHRHHLNRFELLAMNFNTPIMPSNFNISYFIFSFQCIKIEFLKKKYDLPVRAITNEIVAATKRIYTKVSSNYSMIFSNKDCSSSLSNSFGPFYSSLFAASASVRPLSRLVDRCFTDSSIVILWTMKAEVSIS